MSLFTVVQFPNEECTDATSSSTQGTCYTASECTSRGGTASGGCAAGFGVCCIISTSTCSSTISTNSTYIRNTNYPSAFTPTGATTCVFTIEKEKDDVCQLRLDFQTFSGLTVATGGVCTDTFVVEGQTGNNPPTICGTNTGYHSKITISVLRPPLTLLLSVYAEFGTTSTDNVKLTFSFNDLSAKSFNILTRQISCTSPWKWVGLGEERVYSVIFL